MDYIYYKSNAVKILKYFFKWLFLALIVGIPVGAVSAVFLRLLSIATELRTSNSWLFYILPLGGALVSYCYKYYGKNSILGNNLVLSQAAGGDEDIPLILLPLTLFGTVASHLFGASVGREGTAVQMGGAISNAIWNIFKLDCDDRKILIRCGVSAGFSSVFGTPLAGTLFGLEVPSSGQIRPDSLIPCLFSAFFANTTALLLGTNHKLYKIGNIPEINPALFAKLIVSGIIFGITGFIFIHSVRLAKSLYSTYIKDPILRSFIGGIVIILFVLAISSRDYIGLGLPLLDKAFTGENNPLAFVIKLLLTALSLGAGFQGGEVTPLFVIGATLGSTLSNLLSLPTSFLAALGYIGVFSAATNAPITCFIMGIELFGGSGCEYMFLICVLSFFFSGHRSIYSLRKTDVQK
ncbi:MAG: chloride channel protein [Clostridioides sp.]|jgi:H+/Cl- antiporter ClcA|nr:chloride channel protein [Clostridioides sp.]